MSQKVLIRAILCSIITAVGYTQSKAQHRQAFDFPDSTIIAIRPQYDSVTGFHRWIFGHNYRKEWATPVKVPIFHLSQIAGGLMPVREGGGMQSRSLRLIDPSGKGWVIRSVEKTPEKVLPDNLKGTFVVDWFDDAMSSEHPFGALAVPPLASAANIPHTNPIIGVVAPDKALGEFSKSFEGMLVLLEEREPEGYSDNTFKMEAELLSDHASRLNGQSFLRARMLDLLIGDWDRHEDQWRWAYKKVNGAKHYTGVPRDRDQAFHVQEGIGPSVAAVSWINPLLDDFDASIPRPKYSLGKTRFVQAYPDMQFSYQDWITAAHEFVAVETDSVLEASLRRLPPELYALRHAELLDKLRKRRDNIPDAMSNYFRFINETVDLRLSDKSERVIITDTTSGALKVTVDAIDRKGRMKFKLLDMVYTPDVTKEIRLYLEGGNDQILIDNKRSPIRIRMIGRSGSKSYDLPNAAKKVHIYNSPDSISIKGNMSDYTAHLSADTMNTRFVQNNPYNVWMPLATAAVNKDDGFLLGAGFRHTRREGFRKEPYATLQELMLTHSFATSAFRVNYRGEWTQFAGKTDLIINASVNAPNNTVNFFGRGNETRLDKVPGYRTFYRTRYDTYYLDLAARWHLSKTTTLDIGPSFQWYHLNPDENTGRFVNEVGKLNSYDSLTVGKDKIHSGLSIRFRSDQRDRLVLPTSGFLAEVGLQTFAGLNKYSRGYLQIKPQFTWYQRLDQKGILVLTDRVGGGISLGSPAFYQSMFLGGQGNLLGFLANRFAGDHVFYNNFQARLRLFNVASYIIPGQLGITGFNDFGRVWLRGEHSSKWHNGNGGGIYFAPASLTVIQLLAGHSNEGWYPYLSFNLRL